LGVEINLLLIKAGRELHLIKKRNRNESEIRESETQNTEESVKNIYISIVGTPLTTEKKAKRITG